ncbi:MAG TPA: c-type cytochrome [Gemmatimonadaceae bacterium]|nr:c-type cytochrome [Gemmatimonadaceae bacterium]
MTALPEPRMRCHLPTTLCAVLLALALTACDREARRFRESPPSATPEGLVQLSPLEPGVPTTPVSARNVYLENAYAVSEGERRFNSYNCVGCHAHGGGGMGPPLMDDQWIYGSAPENIYETIVEGRPNGMPSFGGRIPSYQIWQLVAYVRSLSALTPSGTRSARTDHMMMFPGSRTLQEPEQPKQSGRPPASEMPPS